MSNPSTVLVYPDPDISQSRTLAVGTGLALEIGGAQGEITVLPGERLSSLANMSSDGVICYTAVTKTYTHRSINGGQGILITNGTGQSNIVVSQDPGTTVQKVNVANSAGTIISQKSTIKFIAGSGITIGLADGG